MHCFQVPVHLIGGAIIQHQPITIAIDCVEGDFPAARRRERLLVIVEGHEALPCSVLDGLRVRASCVLSSVCQASLSLRMTGDRASPRARMA